MNFIFQAKEELYDSASDVEQEDENGYTDGAEVVDVEDLGNIVGKMNEKKKEGVSLVPKEMITPLLRKSLTKQGIQCECYAFSKNMLLMFKCL